MMPDLNFLKGGGEITDIVLSVRNIPKFKDRANWSRATF